VTPHPALPYVYGALIGVGSAIPAAITPAIITDMFRGRHFGAIFGAFHVANAVGRALGPWVGGRVFDSTGSYGPAFTAAAASAAVATVTL
jgi:MFS family permease